MDLTIAAIPGYFGSMAAEHAWLVRHRAERGPTAGDYERRDTITSLGMGVGSLVVPLVTERLLRPLVPGKGRFGRALVATAVTAAVVTTVADQVRRRSANRAERRRVAAAADTAARVGAVVAVAAGGTAVATAWRAHTTADVFWDRRLVRDLGSGPLALALAVFGWDFVYYWNHRWMHTSRQAWALHVVHHSSEHYNLSTALRQPVADSFGVFVPYGLLALLGIRPELIDRARDLNLIYQYWIHTETIRRIGRAEAVLNRVAPPGAPRQQPPLHRPEPRQHPHHLGRLFGTFVPEDDDEPVVYGLTKNLGTFDPVRVATHEYVDILRDVAGADDWRERLSFVLRGPGWAYRRHAELAGVADGAGADPATSAA